jgi:hypothetical protein
VAIASIDEGESGSSAGSGRGESTEPFVEATCSVRLNIVQKEVSVSLSLFLDSSSGLWRASVAGISPSLSVSMEVDERHTGGYLVSKLDPSVIKPPTKANSALKAENRRQTLRKKTSISYNIDSADCGLDEDDDAPMATDIQMTDDTLRTTAAAIQKEKEPNNTTTVVATTPALPPEPPINSIAIGGRVEIKDIGKWWPATIVFVRMSGNVDVVYDVDGSESIDVNLRKVRLIGVENEGEKVGQKVREIVVHTFTSVRPSPANNILRRREK